MTKIGCAPGVSWTPDTSTLTLFDERDGSYHVLNDTGSAIWTALSRGTQPAEISEALARYYGVPIDVVTKDVDAFVAGSLAKGLLVAE